MKDIDVADVPFDENSQGKLEHYAEFLPGFIYQLYMDAEGHFSYPYASNVVEDLFGISAAAVKQDASHLLDMIHPDDFDEVMRSSIAAAETEAPWHAIFRMILKDGRIIYLEAYDRARKFPDGSILWTGYANDITERKELEYELKESEAKFRAFVENANDIIYTLGPDGEITYVSPQWQDLLGHPVEEVINRKFDEYVHPDDVLGCYAFLEKIMRTGIKQSGVEYRIRDAKGNWQWHTSNASPIFDDTGAVSMYLGIGRDITERKVLDAKIAHMAHYDQLTQLPNRSLFFELLNHNLLQDKRHNQALALMFIDLDKFKPVNDNYGHDVGDQLLVAVAQNILDAVRESDVAGRIGGDEFVLFLPHLDNPAHAQKVALHVAEKIRAAVATPYKIEGHQLEVSASIGIALFPDHADSERALAKKADAAMYEAKRQGRNRVIICQ